LDEASAEFQQAQQLDSKLAEAYLGLARLAFSSQKYEDSRANLAKALEINPNLGEEHGLLSEVYRIQNQPEKADKELMTSFQLPKKVPPSYPELKDFLMEGVSSYWYELRGRALLQKGDYAAAIEQLEQAAKIAPDPRLLDTIGIAYQYQKDYHKAIEEHRAALALDPKSAGKRKDLATPLAEFGKS